MARSLRIPQYATGTIAIGALSGGSYPVTGVGTNFLSPDGVTNWTVAVGDILVCGNAMGLVGAINSATSLSLVFWSGGVVGAGASYAINRLTGLPTQAAAGLVQQLLAAVATAAITSGSINGATIGLTTAAAAAFTTLSLAGHAVSDANYSVAAGISVVTYAAITAARTLTLPAASGYAAYQQLLVVDMSGACSASNTITLARAGSDTINGGTSAVVAVPYGYVALASNGSNAWTIVDSNAPFLGNSGAGGAIGLVPAPPPTPPPITRCSARATGSARWLASATASSMARWRSISATPARRRPLPPARRSPMRSTDFMPIAPGRMSSASASPARRRSIRLPVHRRGVRHRHRLRPAHRDGQQLRPRGDDGDAQRQAGELAADHGCVDRLLRCDRRHIRHAGLARQDANCDGNLHRQRDAGEVQRPDRHSLGGDDGR